MIPCKDCLVLSMCISKIKIGYEYFSKDLIATTHKDFTHFDKILFSMGTSIVCNCDLFFSYLRNGSDEYNAKRILNAQNFFKQYIEDPNESKPM